MGDFYSIKTPVARKEHQCYWCREMVTVGERYETITQLDGSLLCHDSFHTVCHVAASKSWDDGNAAYDDPWCDEQHERGKTCAGTPCGNA